MYEWYLLHILLVFAIAAQTPTNLFNLAYKGEKNKLIDLVEQNPSIVNLQNTRNETLLHSALRGRHDQIQRYISHHASESNSNTISHQIQEYQEIIEYLLSKGANISEGLFSPLYYATIFRDSYAISLFISRTSIQQLSEIFSQRDENGRTLIHHAVRSKASGFARFFAYFLRQLKTNKVSNEMSGKQTPSYSKDRGLLDLLKLKLPTSLSFTFMNEAIEDWDIRQFIPKILELQLNFSLIEFDNENNTLLHYCAEDGIYSICEYLLQNGWNALIDTRNTFGQVCFYSNTQIKTPLMLAVIENHVRIIELLKKYNASENIEGNYSKVFNYRDIYGRKIGDLFPQKWENKSIDRRTHLTKEEFIKDYLSLNKPVANYQLNNKQVLISSKNITSTWKAYSKWTKEKIIENYGEFSVSVSALPYGELYGAKSYSMKIKEYVNYMMNFRDSKSPPNYLFDGQIFYKYPNIREDFEIPPIFDFPASLLQFALGTTNSGSPMHFHGRAWNALVFGKKQWWLENSQYAQFEQDHPFTYKDRVLSPHTIVFEQEAGEIVFIPNNWGHAVLNKKDWTCAIAVEF